MEDECGNLVSYKYGEVTLKLVLYPNVEGLKPC